MIMSEPEQALKQFLSRPAPYSGACGCMGPQGDDPLCPCAMKYCENINGNWYQIKETRADGRITFDVEYVPPREEYTPEKVELTLAERLAKFKERKTVTEG